jgi:hypothetical protein
MQRCKSCGSDKKICRDCGAELHKKFDDFIFRAEVMYVIFMAWGFAAAAEAVIRQKNWSGSPALIISMFVLIRFFFAPTKNLYSAALATEDKPRLRWTVFIIDFPFLILHSFIFYTMCVAVAESAENAFRFYQWFNILMVVNVIWLSSIAMRMRLFGHKKHYLTFIKWCLNNSVAVLLFIAAFRIFSGRFGTFFGLFFTKKLPIVISQADPFYWVLFTIAMLNCYVDVVSTASNYLGFDHR